MNVADLYYHGIRQNIRRVLVAMGPERVEKGLSAFEDGASNWSQCFFARAFDGECNLNAVNPEKYLAETLGFVKKDGTPNLVPIRAIWLTFDSAESQKNWMTKKQLEQFISDVLDESRPDAVLALLRSVNYETIPQVEFQASQEE